MSNGRPWTADDLATLRRLARGGHSDREIAELLDRDRTAVVKKRHEHNIEPGRPSALTGIVARLNLRRKLARA